ncbi:ribosomal protein S5 domain 2-type protein [Flammula alnicola]|nr:ribosomal protein S5 domain 2-type protein [Flammula alnicola]
MPRSLSPSSIDEADYLLELQNFLAELSQNPDREPVASEIEVLQSIYGDNAIRLWHPSTSNGKKSPNSTDHTIRYEVLLRLSSPHEDVSLKVLVSLPEAYPKTSPPQLQLLSKYIGPFGADSNLFGSILRTYISVSGVEWSEDTVCVFDGLQNVLDRCVAWYEEKLSAEKAGELVRDDAKGDHPGPGNGTRQDRPNPPAVDEDQISGVNDPVPAVLPAGVQLYVAEPITDRKSAFVGRACRIQHPSEIPLILSHLMSDRRISRAAHPIINAWRCQVDGILHQDNDDDGETAAGGRLAHLLQILEVNNVLVVVTRYFGGIHLGPDRFKHINQAARNALDLGGFLDAPETRKHVGRAKKH